MKKLPFRRIIAYIFDLIFISIILALVMQIEFINPNFDEYHASSTELLELQLSGELEGDAYNNLSYQNSKNGQIYFIVNIIIIVGYYVFFQKYNQGQTLGKKITKVKLVNTNSKKLSTINLLLRTVFIYTIIDQTTSIIFINIVSKENYLNYTSTVSSITMLIFTVCALTMIFNDNDEGLHDKICKTKVIAK